jgi:hypothetical protein
MRQLPGFTAAASLRPPLQHYATEAPQAGGAAHRPLFDGLLNGGGCKPHCGPCRSSLDSPTGCQMYCQTAECDVNTVDCRGCTNPCSGGTFCSGVCTNTKTDPSNCGHCGTVCPAGSICQNGSCTCPAPNMWCGNACIDPQTDPHNCGSCGNVCTSGQSCCNGTCTNPPASGSSSSNDFIVNPAGCGQNIQGLAVTLQITDTIASSNGFDIQLNGCNGSATVAWQQYGFTVQGNSIQGWINNWSNVSATPPAYICCNTIDVCSTPISNGLPAGYQLILSLVYDPNDNVTVTGARYQVLDQNGSMQGDHTYMVSQVGCNCGSGPGGTCSGFQGAADLAPLTAFELVVVGPGGGARANFSSGAGVLTYTSSGQLAQASSVACTAGQCCTTCVGTAERPNATYTGLQACAERFLTQQLSVKPDPTSTAVCFQTNGPCTGASIGSAQDQCITIAGHTQCCHPNWLYGWYPWIKTCSDGTFQGSSCSGPCY